MLFLDSKYFLCFFTLYINSVGDSKKLTVQLVSRFWLQPCGLQQTRLLWPLVVSWSLLKFMSIESVMPSNHLILCLPLLLPSVFPASGSFPVSQLFTSGGQSIGAIVSASILPMNIHSWFPLGLTGLISLLSRDSQESSPAPQFESISSSTLSILYGPALTSVHDYWKHHSFDYMDLC